MVLKKIGVMTSGGDCPGMNAAIRSVVHTSVHYGIKCFGVRLGYKGLIQGAFIELGAIDVKNIIHRGGTILNTARTNEFRTLEGKIKAYNNIEKYGIEGLIVIGGDGSFTGAMVFGEKFQFPIIGIPGTIDNDISGTDFTVGYDTALNTVVEVLDKIRDTAISHKRLFFIEVMGRDSGFIALNSGIAVGALDILITEKKDYNISKLLESIEFVNQECKSSSIIIVAEGNKLGCVYDLAKYTKIRYPFYDIRVLVLGHIQRGGTPSCSDRVLATRLGVASVEALMHGKKNLMSGVIGNEIIFTPFYDAIKKKIQLIQI